VAGALCDQLKIPVVYLTAHADAEILERAKKTAPSGYVLKPFDDRTLRTAIELAFDRHRRERQLIEGGERLTAAIGSIDEGVIVTRSNGKIAVMNRVAEELTGWTQEEALGKPLGEVFVTLHGLTGALQTSPIGRVLREGLSIALGDNTLLRGRHGASTPIQGSAAPVREGDSEAVGVCLLFRAANRHAGDENWGSRNDSPASSRPAAGGPAPRNCPTGCWPLPSASPRLPRVWISTNWWPGSKICCVVPSAAKWSSGPCCVRAPAR